MLNIARLKESVMQSLVILACAIAAAAAADCEPSITTAIGTKAPATICSGDLIFDDEFDSFDLSTWGHERTAAGGGNWEFELYNNNRSNSFVRDGKLYLKPSLTTDQYGDDFLSSGVLNLQGGAPADQCTNPTDWGCERTGNPTVLLNPIISARIRTVESFSFTYGRVEVRAKLPAGDWIWPAIWLLPRYNFYGGWPASGEIDLLESRGNKKLIKNGQNIGSEQTSSTLHFGPFWPLNGYDFAHFERNTPPDNGFDTDFNLFQLEWTPEYIRFGINGEILGQVTPPAGGFWELGQFSSQVGAVDNPWLYGNQIAPFDQPFYFIFDVAVGGTNGYFPDDAENPGGKPWPNTSPQASTDFWNGRGQWLPTWNGDDTALQVDYIKVWAL